MSFRPFAALAALCALALPPTAADAQRQWFEADPIPLRYEIAVTPDAEAGTFAGQADITVTSETTLSSISMNALDLTVSRARIDGRPASFSIDPQAQTLTLTPRRPLRPGQHAIAIDYAGKINDEAFGLFRVSYQADGQSRRALATQFEPGDARRLAPMWDQPNRRAVFSLSLTAPSDQMVVSNMPAAETTRLRGGLTRTRFADTPSMSSYLLFFLVGDFERVTRDVDGIELGVVVRRGQTHRANVALDAGAQSLRYYAEYFGEPYPLPKLDMIGVPGAGGFGAMENWGAILYFDQYLLVDENSSEAEKQNVFGIIAHEIAHQWFGNLVTMNWWDDLWLNEGFASWMAAKATEAIHPDWTPWLAQLTDGTARAMSLDAREGPHPVVQTVNTIDEANLAFDPITYEKGLAVIRMIEAYVGEDAFRNGVRAYIGAHRYGNARTQDLWRAVQEASGEPVMEIARSFTTQPGFPLLSASGDCAGVAVTQRRFATDDAARTNETWSVPVVARRLGQAPLRAVLPATGAARIETGAACGPYLVNSGQSGFFRVLYDDANFAALTQRFQSLDNADQLGLLLDYWAFGRNGDAPFTHYLSLVSMLRADAHPLIAADAAVSLTALADYAQGRPSEAAIKAYGRMLLRPMFDRVGWDPRAGESPSDTLLRSKLIPALASLDDAEVIAEVRRRVRADNPALLPGAIRNAVMAAYAAKADEAAYEDLLARAQAASDFVEQRRLWRWLASAEDEALARRTLALILGEEIPRLLRTQVLGALAAQHPRLGWDFLVANRAAVEALLDPLQRLEYPAGLASLSADPAVADALIVYARDFPEGARPQVASAASSIRERARFIAERMPAVEAWIAARQAPRRR